MSRLSAISNYTRNLIRLRKLGSIASHTYGLQKIASSGRRHNLKTLKDFVNYSNSVTLCAGSDL